jgi:hypothetical protein
VNKLNVSVQKNGVFVEAGAGDGEEGSRTLYLERRMEWSGVLLEPSPDLFSILMAKRRKSALVPACLSSTAQASYVSHNLFPCRLHYFLH